MQRARLLLMTVLWEGFFSQINSYHVIVNETVTVQEGLCVLIPCTFTFPEDVKLGDKPHGFWFSDKSIVSRHYPVASSIASRNVTEETRGRFKLVGDLRKQDCTLRIDDAKKRDRGKYFFRIEGEFNYSYKHQMRPYVNVINLWEQPMLSFSAVPVLGTPVSITCTAPGRCAGTAPNITWAGTLNTANSTANVSSINKNRTFTHASRITFTPSIENQNKTLTCVVYYPAGGESTQTTFILNVQFGPTFDNNSICVFEHHKIICSCLIQSNPPPEIWWMINEELVTGNYSNGTLQVSSTIHGHTGTSFLTLQSSESSRHLIACLTSDRYGTLIMKPPKRSRAKVIRTKPILQGGVYGAVIMSLLILLGFLLILAVRNYCRMRQRDQSENGVDAMRPRMAMTAARSPASVDFFISEPEEENNNGDESIHVTTFNLYQADPKRKLPLPPPEHTEYSELKGRMVTV